jgi:hypothetical protein
MIIAKPKRLQVLQYTFKKNPEPINIKHLGQNEKRLPKNGYERTFQSGGMGNELVGRAYSDAAPQKVTMVLVNRAENSIFGALSVFAEAPNLLI